MTGADPEPSRPKGTTPCPKCGRPLIFRAGDLECPACGYFAAAPAGRDSAPRQPATPPSHPARWGDAAQEELPAPAVRRLQTDPAAGRLTRHRQVFLGTFFVLFTAGNVLLVLLEAKAPVAPRAWGLLLMASVVLTGIVALVLFIDWTGIKKLALGLLVLALAFCVYDVTARWESESILALVKPVVDTALLVWLGVLLAADIRLNS